MSKEPLTPKGVDLYDPEDVVGYRQRMFEGVKEEISSLFPYAQNGVRLEAKDIGYDRTDDFTPSEEKIARENGRSLHFRLRGKLKLVDEQTGQTLDAKEMTLAQVPWITPRGTALLDGREIASSNQARLLPGVYTRRRESGELESHFNPKAGTSASQFRVIFEPASATYRLQVGSSANLHFYSLMNALGVPDDDLKKAWGPEIFDINSKKVDSGVLERAYKVMVPDWMKTPDADKNFKADLVRKSFERAKVHRFVAETNLPEMMFGKKASGSVQAPPLPDFKPEIDFHKAASCVWWLYDLDYPTPDFFVDSSAFVRKQASLPGGKPYEWLSNYAIGDEGAVNMGWADNAAELMPKVAAGDPRAAWVMVSYMTDPLNYADNPVRLAQDMVNYRESLGGIDKMAKDVASRRIEARMVTEQPRSMEQARAGNYRKGKFSLRGLIIVIETAKGQTRKGKDNAGKTWQIDMKDDYGYILRTDSEADGDHMDVFLGPELASDSVYVIDQLNEEGEFDEHKCMIGYVSAEKAKKAYERNYSDGRKVKHITHISFRDFKDWLKTGDSKKPAKDAHLAKKAGYGPPMLAVSEAIGILDDPVLSEVWFGEYSQESQGLEKEAAEKYAPWVGIDLDGTLAYAGDSYNPKVVGDPVPSMMELIAKLKAKGKTVKIFTARASDPEHIPVVEAWLEEQGLGGLEVTNIKDPGLRLIIDDRAVGVRRNKGVEGPVIDRVLKRALSLEADYFAEEEYV